MKIATINYLQVLENPELRNKIVRANTAEQKYQILKEAGIKTDDSTRKLLELNAKQIIENTLFCRAEKCNADCSLD